MATQKTFAEETVELLGGRELSEKEREDQKRRAAAARGKLSGKAARQEHLLKSLEITRKTESGEVVPESEVERIASEAQARREAEALFEGKAPKATKAPKVKVEKPKKERKPKVEKPKAPRTEEGWRLTPTAHASEVNRNGHSFVSPQMIDLVFEDKKSGMKNGEIATKHNISEGTVSIILSGPAWQRVRMTRYAHSAGLTSWEYPAQLPRVKKEKVVKEKATKKAEAPVEKEETEAPEEHEEVHIEPELEDLEEEKAQ